MTGQKGGYKEFKVPVLPGCRVPERRTPEKIEEFVRSGGTPVITGRMPGAFREEGEGPEVLDRALSKFERDIPFTAGNGKGANGKEAGEGTISKRVRTHTSL